MNKQEIMRMIEENADLFCGVSDKIWETPELSLKEDQACALYVKTLQELGFAVESPYAGIRTSFLASYGSGRPVIGFLAEYDALSGLSQEGGAAIRKELVKGGCGHGCGHNMLGAASLAAACAVKRYLETLPAGSGTVRLYGCPGEEGGAAKAFMARDGVFKELDCALAWHPGDCNQVQSGTCNSCIQTEYAFEGIAAHAAGSPEYGRSALDAVELMNTGVQYLREHMPSEARIHYAITDTGGPSPNVVQPHAQVLYMVRSVLVKDALSLQERVDDIAKGAALMTGTRFRKKFIDGCSNQISNAVLEELIYRNMTEIGVPAYTEEERAYAAKIMESYDFPPAALPGDACAENAEIRAFVEQASDGGRKAINDFIVPYLHSNVKRAGSTDVGDVSWQTPTAQFNTACFVSGSPGHSWQNVSCGKTSIGHKGMLFAAKIMAASALDLYQSPEILQKAREEFLKTTKGGFVSPVPEGAVPVLSGEHIEVA